MIGNESTLKEKRERNENLPIFEIFQILFLERNCGMKDL